MADFEPPKFDATEPGAPTGGTAGGTPPAKASKTTKILLIIVGGILGLPTCCCLGILGFSFVTSGNEVVLSNPRGTLVGIGGGVQVDYVFPKGPDRRMRYHLVVEAVDGQRAEWLFLGELAKQGTFDTRMTPGGLRLGANGPFKLYVEADGPARRQERCSNVVVIP